MDVESDKEEMPPGPDSSTVETPKVELVKEEASSTTSPKLVEEVGEKREELPEEVTFNETYMPIKGLKLTAGKGRWGDLR